MDMDQCDMESKKCQEFKCSESIIPNLDGQNDEAFDCNYCDQEFQNEFDLINHKNEFHQEIPLMKRTILEEAYLSKR